MTESEPPRVTFDDGIACGFDDAWHERWWAQMEETGGNIIAAYRTRMVEANDDRVVMSMEYQPAARQGTGVYAAGILMQLADVGATSACFGHMRKTMAPEDMPFPLSVQISTNLLRNTDRGKIISETRLIHGGRSLMVAESTVRDEEGRTLAVVTTTHMVPRR